MKEKLVQQLKDITRLSPLYRKAWRLQIETEQADVEEAVRHAIKNVPFYKDYGKYIADGFDIKKLPILRKSDIMGRERELVSKRVPSKLLYHKKTGGSTGHSLHLYYSIPTIFKKDVITDYSSLLVGKNLRTALLRGYVPDNDALMQELRPGYLILSSYKLSAENFEQYVQAMIDLKAECLMAYPSSLGILTRLIKEKYGVSPIKSLKGIITSSEIFSADQRALVMKVFPGVKLIDLYGHNELVVRAISEDGKPYRFFQNYGYTEFVETGETLPNGNRIAEIVGTSIMNRAMPFIRYGTEDYVELDSESRPIAILGRTSDYVVNKKGRLVPCIFLEGTDAMENVRNFQFFQPEPGKLVYRVIVNDKFGPRDVELLRHSLTQSFPDMDCSVETTDKMYRTKIGKQPQLEQRVDLSKYR